MRSNPVPRWSVVMPAGTSELLPASMAGLPATRAWVRVGPPLSLRVVLIMLPTGTPVMSVPPKPELVPKSPMMLWLLLLKFPDTSGFDTPVLPAMIVFFTLIVPELLKIPPPLLLA